MRARTHISGADNATSLPLFAEERAGVASRPSSRMSGEAVPTSFGPARLFESARSIACGLKRALIAFVVITVLPLYSWGATPNGTTISNTGRANYTLSGVNSSSLSNRVEVVTVPLSSPAAIEIMKYAPTYPAAESVVVSTTESSSSGTSSGPFTTLPAPTPLGASGPLDLSQPVKLAGTDVFHEHDTLFFRLTDLDNNRQYDVIETVLITVTVPTTGESEMLRLRETGPDTGVFTGYITLERSAAAANNGILNYTESGYSVTASYSDIYETNDVVRDSTLIDPAGMVFDSSNGNPVDGARITLIDASTGQPASVLGDDGIASYPSTVTSGSTVTDSSGRVYSFTPGEYRFPYVKDGQYRVEIVPPSGYTAPSTVDTATLQSLSGGPFSIDESGSRGGEFTVSLGPAFKMDIPIDPVYSWLYLTKTASKSTVAIGDFLQYKITVDNTSADYEVNNIAVSDKLPLGFRYRSGSTRIGGEKAADPSISSDGRTLTFNIGSLAASGSTEIRYVVEIAAGARIGIAWNRASAVGTTVIAGVKVTSNEARASVEVTEDLYSEKAFIVGRVADTCEGAEGWPGQGVEGVRIYLEDGTYAVTDKNGMYHFTGVNPGAHVVQLDLITIPEKYELASCEENSRFAGVSHSQFVDVQGGTLWRADFYLAAKPVKEPPKVEVKGEVSIELNSYLQTQKCDASKAECRGAVEYEIPVKVSGVPLKNLRLSIILPDGAEYLKGSSSLNGSSVQDPSVIDTVLIYRLSDAEAGWAGKLKFIADLSLKGDRTEALTKALLTFDTDRGTNLRAPMAENAMTMASSRDVKQKDDIVLYPRFGVLDATLGDQDKVMLDRVIEDLKSANVRLIEVIGHTDSDKIRKRAQGRFADNYQLSRARAASVAEYLSKGLGLKPSQVMVVGLGSDRPVADNATPEGKAMNRRVELKVIAEEISMASELNNVRDKSGPKSMEVVGLSQTHVRQDKTVDKNAVPDFDAAWFERQQPGLEWAWPYEGYHPPIPSAKLAVKHDPEKIIKLFLNGKEVDAIYLDSSSKRWDGKVGVSYWRGIQILDGGNLFEAAEYDRLGNETGRISKIIHYSGNPVKVVVVPEKSRLTADGKTPSVIAVRLTDKDGHPAREDVIGEYAVDSPFTALKKVEEIRNNPLSTSGSERFKYLVEDDGIAYIKLEPTVQTGEVTLRFNLDKEEQAVKAWIRPEARDWILVGIAEGTVGYNTVSGNMESLDDSDAEEEFYKDGRTAFFAKGKIKGEWLLTMAYDSDKRWKPDTESLYQTIPPDEYYTIYGDASEQRHEAASQRPLYVKIERDRFYAVFGDISTGLTVTELAKYSRSFNGFKSELKGDLVDFNVFVSNTDQIFVKDEIPGDGTSGLYRLSRQNIVMNSESVVIETRDRYRSEEILSSQTLTRYTDYSIDYEDGTIYFKSPVNSHDEDFNPLYIVVGYETNDNADSSYTYGGRAAVRFLDKKMEVGATYVHEGRGMENGDMAGVDATVNLTESTRLKAEYAETKNDFSGSGNEGSAYLAEVQHNSTTFKGKAYVREQMEEFGLGQESESESGTEKYGFEASYRLTELLTLDTEAYRQTTLSTDAVSDLAEAQIRYSQKTYELRAGLRHAETDDGNGDLSVSDQVTAGGTYRMLDGRLTLGLERDQSLFGNNGSDAYPTSTRFKAEYKLNDTASLYASQEYTEGDDYDTATTSVGMKASPWDGGRLSSSVGNELGEDGTRVYSTMGLNQSWKINEKWSMDGGLDRSDTIKDDDGDSDDSSEDFTTVSLGAGYKQKKWGWNGRVERKFSEENKLGISTAVYGEPKEGIGTALSLQLFKTDDSSGGRSIDSDLRFSLAYRPKGSALIVLDRLDYIVEEEKGSDSDYENWKIVNNINANWKLNKKTQISMQYGAKYVRETIDDEDYSGYTDLIGLEGRYDVTRRWDVGFRGSVLHSWEAGQYNYLYGPSVGLNLARNVWLSIGYNIDGFKDEDFSKADYTAEGPYIKFRIKFDQFSAIEAVKWASGQSRSSSGAAE